MKTAMKNCNLQLYTDDVCILYSYQNVKFIDRNLNDDFNNICEWLIDNKLSTHFGEDKTKSILFKRGNKSNLSLNITKSKRYKTARSDQILTLLDENMSGKVWKKEIPL